MTAKPVPLPKKRRPLIPHARLESTNSTTSADASCESNDEATSDDLGSSDSPATVIHRRPTITHALMVNGSFEETHRPYAEGEEGYDGDIESTADGRITPPNTPPRPKHVHATQRRPPPVPSFNLEPGSTGDVKMRRTNSSSSFDPVEHEKLATMGTEELQEYVKSVVENQSEEVVRERGFRINAPPVGRTVRLYADGVYDLFHYAHALSFRQAKLMFPSVHLLVGVCSDELVMRYKNKTILTSQERYESVRNCRWVDEVVEDAPWEIDQEFLDRHKIDYVVHDAEPYKGENSDDVYGFVKKKGMFMPSRRTAGISTSDLLQRIVIGYKEGCYDGKLIKIGHPELASHPPSDTEMSPNPSKGGRKLLSPPSEDGSRPASPKVPQSPREEEADDEKGKIAERRD
ncbi:hypothetical protein BT69DRAFT_1281087 [Atractiella rhizophila]|nr:hypothetical protein BT69DRAFT_1281087 [Atractiella rhizophila]